MSKEINFGSLDALAKEYKLGPIRYTQMSADGKDTQTTYRGAILGYVWSIPRRSGEPKVAALVIETEHGTTGHIYPEMVAMRHA